MPDAEFARELEEFRERLRNTESQLVEERNRHNELMKQVILLQVLSSATIWLFD